ncbi:hypothetical protein FI667_g4483, partial [Globisporangium splendens]
MRPDQNEDDEKDTQVGTEERAPEQKVGYAFCSCVFLSAGSQMDGSTNGPWLRCSAQQARSLAPERHRGDLRVVKRRTRKPLATCSWGPDAREKVRSGHSQPIRRRAKWDSTNHAE